MSPLTNFDLFLLGEILIKLTLVTHTIRYLITYVLPQEFREYFDTYARGVRNQSINYSDKYFPNTSNFEVVILSRIFIPLFFMLSVNTYLDFILESYVFGRYLLTGYVFYLLQLYFFLNIAPNLDDLELLYEANGVSKLVFVAKIFVIFNFYTILSPLTISLILVIPISDFMDFKNYTTEYMAVVNPAWERT